MKRKEKEFGGCRDLISSLPDSLICHILSFLPTKEASSTCVLAKRWKCLLAFVPNLELDDSFYFHPPMTYVKRRKTSRHFMHFVDRVLALQAKAKAPLKSFHVKCKDVVDQYWVIDWISKVLKRGVLDIDLYMSLSCCCSHSSYFPLACKIFVSKTLVKLKMKFEYGFKIDVEGDVCLPKLKSLHLDDFQIKPSMFNKLLSGCHALQDLELIDMMWCNSRQPCSVTVSIPTLKRLMFCHSEDFYKVSDSVSLSIDNPNLVYLDYFDTIVDMYQEMSFDSLVEARLRLEKTRKRTETDQRNVTNLLMGIRNVMILYLSDESLAVLACCPEIIPVFKNVIQLTIKTTPDLNWDPLPTLLKNCPNLKTLVFEGLHHNYTSICEEEDGCLCKYQEVRTCLSSSPAKVLKILKFGEAFDEFDYDYDEGGIEKQIDQVKHFLKTMPNLEQMILYYNAPNDEDVMKVFKKLQDQLPRVASAKCNVQIISTNLSLSLPKCGTLLL